jgi:hypothetical protein
MGSHDSRFALRMFTADSGGLLGRLSEFYHFAKSGWVQNRHLSQHFPVDLDVGSLQVADQLAVAHAVKTSRRIDTGDPQPTKIALPFPAIAVGIPECLHYLLIRCPKQLRVGATKSLRQLQNLFAPLPRYIATLNPCHDDLIPLELFILGLFI